MLTKWLANLQGTPGNPAVIRGRAQHVNELPTPVNEYTTYRKNNYLYIYLRFRWMEYGPLEAANNESELKTLNTNLARIGSDYYIYSQQTWKKVTLNIVADIDNKNSLPNCQEGDLYIVGDNLYSFSKGNWIDVGNLRGPKGETGETGSSLLSIIRLQELPEENINRNAIYLIPQNGQTPNICDEYVYTDDGWEKFGVANIDLSNYYNKEEVDEIIATYNEKLNTINGYLGYDS